MLDSFSKSGRLERRFSPALGKVSLKEKWMINENTKRKNLVKITLGTFIVCLPCVYSTFCKSPTWGFIYSHSYSMWLGGVVKGLALTLSEECLLNRAVSIRWACNLGRFRQNLRTLVGTTSKETSFHAPPPATPWDLNLEACGCYCSHLETVCQQSAENAVCKEESRVRN